MQNVKLEVNKTILELCANQITPKSHMNLRDDLGFDSLKMVELIVDLERRFHFEFEESDLDPQAIDSVEDIYNLVAKYVNVH